MNNKTLTAALCTLFAVVGVGACELTPTVGLGSDNPDQACYDLNTDNPCAPDGDTALVRE